LSLFLSDQTPNNCHFQSEHYFLCFRVEISMHTEHGTEMKWN